MTRPPPRSPLFPYTTLSRSSRNAVSGMTLLVVPAVMCAIVRTAGWCASIRSEEHTSELQSPVHLVCRLLLEKKKEARAGLADIGTAMFLNLVTVTRDLGGTA